MKRLDTDWEKYLHYMYLSKNLYSEYINNPDNSIIKSQMTEFFKVGKKFA